MTASDYPISFPYGATSAPYSISHPHRGDDRACPTGTQVLIGGVVIGLTGMTGLATGPHLHIQEWQSNIVTGIRRPQNAFQPGTVINIDPSGTQGDGSFGKFITIRTADGWNDSYCHLNQINVKIGDVIGENTMPQKQDVTNYFLTYLGYPPTSAQMTYYTSNVWQVLASDICSELLVEKNKLILTQDVAQGEVQKLYEDVTGISPTKDNSTYWTAQLIANPNQFANLHAGLRESDNAEKGTHHQYKAYHYDADLAAAQGGDPKVLVNGKEYVKK